MSDATSTRRPTAVGVAAVALATATMLALAVHNALWVQPAGSPSLLDAGETVATLAWIVGWWILMPWALGASLVLLALAARRALRRRGPVPGDGAALALSTALLVGAVLLAPLWDSGTA